MKLRHAAASPFVRKVMVAAHELALAGKIALEPTNVSPLRTNETLASENPLMKVPSFVTDDGQVLYGSPVICEYLDSLAGGGMLIPAGGPERWTALRRQALADGILDAVILCRYESLRPEERRWSGWTDGQMTKARQGVAAAAAEDLAGLSTIGHIAIACMLGYLDFRFPDDGWRRRHPGLAAWFAEVDERPSMRLTRPPAALDDRPPDGTDF
jgi:glutathione S-transferase